MNGRYKEKLQNQFIKSTLIPVVIFFGIITLALSVYINGYAHYNLKQWSNHAAADVTRIYTYYEEFLSDKNQHDNMNAFFAGEMSEKKMTQSFRIYCSDAEISAELLLLDKKGAVVYFSGSSDLLQPHLKYYVRLLFENRSADSGCRSTIYHYAPSEMHKWLLMTPLSAADGTPSGQALVLIDAATLAEYFRASGYETVITDDSGMAAMSTNIELLDNRSHFSPDEGHRFTLNGTDYLLRRADIPQANSYIYTLAVWQSWSDYYILGCFALVIVAALLLIQSRKFARQLADSSARSLEKLHAEFAAVQENPQHRLAIESDDEFGDIAQRINDMLSDIQELNQKSLALERSRNDTEIAQIKAYFRPHFIYNTLESIHFSILMNDTARAGDVLLKLTSLLRYSIDNTVAFFTLEEDMEHLEEYMDIMQFRHGDRFTWTFSVAEDTRHCLVPPLFIQPLVENSLKYGFAECERIHIEIRTWMEDDALQISIHDNGVGMTPQQLEHQRRLVEENLMEAGHFGIGLIARSVRLQYGEGSTVLLDSTPGEGLTVRLSLKRRKDNGI